MLTVKPVVQPPNKSKLPSFGYRLPNAIFDDIRELPHLRCACCGGDMFEKVEMKSFLRGFEAGSKRTLENAVMAKFKGTPAFTFLSELSAIAPKMTIRRLVKMPENQAKIHTLDAYTQLDINMMALVSDGVSIRAPRFLDKFDKYYEQFLPEHQRMLDLMDAYALRYPDNTFAEIFNKPEIFNLHSKIAARQKDTTLSKRVDVFKSLHELAQDYSQEDLQALQKTNGDAMVILNNHFYKSHIKKELIFDLYKSFIGNTNGRVKEDEVLKLVDCLPMGEITPDKFIEDCVLQKRSDMDIVRYFANELQATYEHYQARSKKGEDVKENIIIMCGKCNRERANLPYPFFLRFHAEMPVNMQKQLNKIMTFIRHGKLTGYDSFPFDIKQNLLDGSDALIRPKVGEYLKFRRNQVALQLEKSGAAVVQNQERVNIASEKLEDVNSQIKELEAQLRKLKKQKQVAKSEYDYVKKDLDNSVSWNNYNTAQLDDIEKIIVSDRETNDKLRLQKRKFPKRNT